jgi:O-antigen/teichoic acid export membrane protein
LKWGNWRYQKFVRNIGWNLIGQGAPLLAALISIPLLIKGLGVDRFGILTIGWMLIGYFSLFDLGIGRALTQIIAAKLAANEHSVIPLFIWTGLSIMLLLGLVTSLMIVGASPWIVDFALNIPISLQLETKQALYVLAPTIPLVVLASGLRGVLEATQEFKAVNLVRIPLGVLMFAAPVCVLPYSHSLGAAFFSLLLVRLLTTLALWVLCRRAVPGFRQFSFSRSVVPELLKFGGWMTVSNIVSPIMVQMDRFLIGAMMSVAAVAYYATPYEMVTKLLIIPAAIAGVCFPAVANMAGRQAHEEAQQLYGRSCKYAFILLLPAVVIFELFAGEILHLWLGAKFSQESTIVFQILTIGVLINGVAQIPFAFLQGGGRSDITAKLHLVEVVIYLPLLWIAVKYFGISGAAVAWTVRVMIDAVALHFFTHSIYGRSRRSAVSVK